jgi:hypothetical protein
LAPSFEVFHEVIVHVLSCVAHLGHEIWVLIPEFSILPLTNFRHLVQNIFFEGNRTSGPLGVFLGALTGTTLLAGPLEAGPLILI